MDNENFYGLKEIHGLLIEAMDEFDRICRANNIKYSLHGGTLLGAERNGCLIPWDDDLDISMTRVEFKKLQVACTNTQNEYYLNEVDTWLPRFTSKDKNKPRVFIDIFIWDYISEKKLSQGIKINLLRMMQGTLKRNIDLKNYSATQKILLIITHIIGIPFSRQAKLRLFKLIEEKWLLGNKEYIHRSNDAFKGVSYIFKGNFMDNYTSIILENREYMVTSRYKEFLERNYGSDYLTPPDVVERKPLHSVQRNNFIDD